MKKVYMTASVALVTVLSVAMLGGTVQAWHPKGEIKKLVQNQTANSGAPADANDDATAVSAKPGDVLKYVIQISNNGNEDERGHNDMHFVVLTDTLPAGVELVSDPAKREVKETIGVIKPGETVTKEYLVKVTSQQNGFIDNKACFTGDSEVKDSPQKGCDNAKVRVTVPQILATSTPPAPVELPKTGPSSVLVLFAGASGAGYAVHRFASRLRK